MKNPPGYGSITKLSGKRRRPFLIREGKSGHQQIIGYAATKLEAMEILAEYNHNPIDLTNKNALFEDVYRSWSLSESKLSEATRKTLVTAYKHCESLYHRTYSSLKTADYQDVINSDTRSSSAKNKIRQLFVQMEGFALQNDLISKSYTPYLTIPGSMEPETERKPFTKEEVDELWRRSDEIMAKIALILLYTGLRIGELRLIKVEDVDLQEKLLKGGIKTAAGKNRLIPIHNKILPIVSDLVNSSKSGYLIENHGKQYSIATLENHWSRNLAIGHIPHECRHTFRSWLDSKNGNSKCIDLLMGHKSQSVGQRVYTHKTIEELRETINLLD